MELHSGFDWADYIMSLAKDILDDVHWLRSKAYDYADEKCYQMADKYDECASELGNLIDDLESVGKEFQEWMKKYGI